MACQTQGRVHSTVWISSHAERKDAEKPALRRSASAREIHRSPALHERPEVRYLATVPSQSRIVSLNSAMNSGSAAA
jgi:hypothetical protein